MAYGRGAAAVRAIDEVTLDIARGEFIAVVGPSGCGKSSLMKLISGLHPPASGALDGRRKAGHAARSGPSAWRSRTRTCCRGAPRSRTCCCPWRSSSLTGSDFSKQKYAGKAQALLESVGLQGFTEKHPWELSGGMQQRASICRALIHEPEILLLDEPFGALDAFTREELWVALRDLQAARKVTVMLVTHDLREAVFLADTVYVMSSRPGRIVRRCPVNLPRPRDLEVTYTQPFQDVVHELRSLIRG